MKSTKFYNRVSINIKITIMLSKPSIFIFITYYLSSSKSCRLQDLATIVIWPMYFYLCFVCFNIYLLADGLKESILKYVLYQAGYKLPLSSFRIFSHWTSLFFGAPLIVCIILSTYKSLPNLFLQRVS